MFKRTRLDLKKYSKVRPCIHHKVITPAELGQTWQIRYLLLIWRPGCSLVATSISTRTIPLPNGQTQHGSTIDSKHENDSHKQDRAWAARLAGINTSTCLQKACRKHTEQLQWVESCSRTLLVEQPVDLQVSETFCMEKVSNDVKRWTTWKLSQQNDDNLTS